MPVETFIYTTLVGDDEPIEELPAEIISYGYRLNRPGSLTFKLALDHPFCRRSIINPGRHEAVVVRNRAIVWRGPVLTAQETDTKTERSVTFGGEGLLAYLKRWHITSTLTFATTDQFTIARALLTHHQDKAGGDFNIDTSAVTTSGVLRDRTYDGFQRKNIYEALTELAEVQNGFEFEVNPENRAFDLFYPRKGSQKPDLIFEDGIRAFTRGIDATTQSSQTLGVGAGEGDDMLVFNLQDSTAVATFGLTNLPYVNKDVSVASTLQSHVQRELSLMKNPAQTVGVTVGTTSPQLFSYTMGDTGRLVYPSEYEAVNEFRRLVGLDVVWNQGLEEAILYLEQVL